MTPELFARLEALGPRFKLPLHALTMIDEKFGRAAMLEHALRANDEPTRLIALMMHDYTLATNVMTDQVRARTPKQIAKRKKRVTQLLERAKTWAEQMPRSTH